MVQSFGDRSGNIAGGNLFTGFDKRILCVGRESDRQNAPVSVQGKVWRWFREVWRG